MVIIEMRIVIIFNGGERFVFVSGTMDASGALLIFSVFTFILLVFTS